MLVSYLLIGIVCEIAVALSVGWLLVWIEDKFED